MWQKLLFAASSWAHTKVAFLAPLGVRCGPGTELWPVEYVWKWEHSFQAWHTNVPPTPDGEASEK